MQAALVRSRYRLWSADVTKECAREMQVDVSLQGGVDLALYLRSFHKYEQSAFLAIAPKKLFEMNRIFTGGKGYFNA